MQIGKFGGAYSYAKDLDSAELPPDFLQLHQCGLEIAYGRNVAGPSISQVRISRKKGNASPGDDGASNLAQEEQQEQYVQRSIRRRRGLVGGFFVIVRVIVNSKLTSHYGIVNHATIVSDL